MTIHEQANPFRPYPDESGDWTDILALLRETGEQRRALGLVELPAQRTAALRDYRGLLKRHYRHKRIRQRFIHGLLIGCMVAFGLPAIAQLFIWLIGA